MWCVAKVPRPRQVRTPGRRLPFGRVAPLRITRSQLVVTGDSRSSELPRIQPGTPVIRLGTEEGRGLTVPPPPAIGPFAAPVRSRPKPFH